MKLAAKMFSVEIWQFDEACTGICTTKYHGTTEYQSYLFSV